MEKVKDTFSENRSNIKKLVLGSGISIIITLIGLFIFSLLLTYTAIKENTVPTITMAISAVSILIGSIIAVSQTKKNGIINGMAVATIYVLFIYLLSSIITKDFKLNMQSIIMVIACIIAGGIGGIVGINKQ